MFKAQLRRELARQPFDVWEAEMLSIQIHMWETRNSPDELPSEDRYLWHLLSDRIIEERNKIRNLG